MKTQVLGCLGVYTAASGEYEEVMEEYGALELWIEVCPLPSPQLQKKNKKKTTQY